MTNEDNLPVTQLLKLKRKKRQDDENVSLSGELYYNYSLYPQNLALFRQEAAVARSA
jgi:hypothetical protein